MKQAQRQSSVTKRHILLLPVFLVAVIALIFTVQTASAGHHHHRPEVVELDDAKIIAEVNATDGDAGYQIFLDGEGWRRVTVYDPNWRQIFKVNASGGVKKIGGGTELFLETAEPEYETFEEFQEILDSLQPGIYKFYGRTVEGDRLHGSAELTHNIPCAPELVSPSEVDLEDEFPDNVPDRLNEPFNGDPVNISWEEVDSLLGEDPDEPDAVGCTDDEGAEIDGYQVIVEGEDGEFDVILPATTTNVDLPLQFTDTSKAYKFEVLAIEESGNQTIVESYFCTQPISETECLAAALALD